ncbi:MAG: hypothetical protein FJW23_07160 [Acidimicrobiia bacterium]|nr:hypothetical protein [Acidimicrobiia bacterium]
MPAAGLKPFGKPVDEIMSTYGATFADLAGERDRHLGIEGTEITVRNLQTGESIGTTRFFAIPDAGRFCGASTNGEFDTDDFLIRALGLNRVDAGAPAGAE